MRQISLAFYKPISPEAGPSIAELYNLNEYDPWQKTETDSLSKRTDDLQRKIADRWEKEGFFEEPAFIDPPDDDDPTILSHSSLSTVWRLCVVNMRLIDIIELEPSIKKISLAFKNTSEGCWMAFTGKRIAMKIEGSLKARGIVSCLTVCDINGTTTGVTSTKPDDFYYCIAKYERNMYAYFVPASYWETHGEVFTGDLDIFDRVKHLVAPTEVSYRGRALSSDMLRTKVDLDKLGFRENLLFQAFINDL